MGTPGRPRWRIGQILQPRDLRALEAALSAEAAQRVQSIGLPAYGITAIDWGCEDSGNLVFLRTLVAVLPGGTAVDVPGNATVSNPLDLAATEKAVVDVYLYLVESDEDDRADPEDSFASAPAAEVVLSRYELVLSANPDRPAGRERMRLGQYRRGADNRYRPVDGSPPLLSIDADGKSAIKQRLDTIGEALVEISSKLDILATDAATRGLPLAPIQRVRIELRKLHALLMDLRQRVPLRPHPYWVFSALRSFVLELSVLDEAGQPAKLPPYDHDRPWPAFSAVFDAISKWASWSPAATPRVEFLPDGAGRLVASPPDDALHASEVYVVVLKQDDAFHAPPNLRLASPDRLRLVREYSLEGVPFVREANPPFRFGFSSGTEFYARRGGGDEWEHVVRDGAIAFRSAPGFDGQRFILCWRGR